jgi:hypothetical protein
MKKYKKDVICDNNFPKHFPFSLSFVSVEFFQQNRSSFLPSSLVYHISKCILMTIFTIEMNTEKCCIVKKMVEVSEIFRFSEFSIFDCSEFVNFF